MVQELVRYIITSFVDKPESVQIDYRPEGARGTVLIKVDARDMGKIIGKNGCTIKSLRTFVTLLQLPDGPVNIDIVE